MLISDHVIAKEDLQYMHYCSSGLDVWQVCAIRQGLDPISHICLSGFNRGHQRTLTFR